MKYVLGVLGVIAVVGVLTAFTLVGGFLTFQNGANGHENGIKAQYTQNQNNYDNGFKKVLEVAQVSEFYAADFEKIYRSVLEGRYGANGSQAAMQWIQEQNPSIDSALYRQIQQTIEAFRNQFSQEQKQLISRKQEYENYLTTVTSNRFYNYLGGVVGGSYPKIDLAKYDIVTSGATATAFDTKRADPLTIRRGQ